MKCSLFLIFAAALYGQIADQPAADQLSDDPQNQEQAEANVNSRYTIESIGFTKPRNYRLSNSAVEQMQQLIGSKLNTDAVQQLARKICGELRAHEVTFRVARGGNPDSVRVLLEVNGGVGNFDLSIPKFAYNSSQGWTAIGEASGTFGANKVSVDLITDSDSLIEHYSGVSVRYNRFALGSDRVRLDFEFDAFNDRYDSATLAALNHESTYTSSSLGAGAYGSRMNFEPSATFVLARPVTLTVGFSFEQLDPQVSAARPEAANAVINTLRYHQRWENSDATNQELDAGYSLRAATRMLGSDLRYTKHEGSVRYGWKHDRQSIEVALVAGVIYGQAPLFERFVLGNSSTLRGWNKFDIDPLGGNRTLYGSVTYGYHIMRVFYDTGAVWDQGVSPEPKHSVGIGVASGLGLFHKGAILLAVAFPIERGRADPVFIAGMNF